MKKLLMAATVVLALAGLANASIFMIEAKGGYFSPSGNELRDHYGSGLIVGGEATFGIFPGLKLWAGANYFSKKGTVEGARLTLTPVGGGLKYILPVGIMRFYAGPGINYNHYKETTLAGDVKNSALGYVVKIGAILKPGGGLLVDIFIDNYYGKVKVAGTKATIGGVVAGIGFGFESFI